MEINAVDASRIVGQLEAAGLVVWLDGGWGVDALLGRQTRPHQDLDLVIAREDLAVAQQTLAAAGFSHDPTAVPGLPARLLLVDADGRQVDLHPVIFDRHGNGWQDLGADAWGAYPAEELTATGRDRRPTGALQEPHPGGSSSARLPAQPDRPTRSGAAGQPLWCDRTSRCCRPRASA
jgi:lincosamide nucleotidyltransferase A/C/D/E